MASKRFDEKVTIRMTKAMLADLQVIATKTKLPIPAIIRTAIRNYLDGTDLTLGTRRTFARELTSKRVGPPITAAR
jgi:predicted transcriptional regulator